jgi:hypothetical protein
MIHRLSYGELGLSLYHMQESIILLYKMMMYRIYMEKIYILAPQTTTISPDGTPNYQHLHSDSPNYHFLIFWPHPSFIPLILTEIGQKPENTPPLTVRISKCRRSIFGILFRINGINGQMGPKNQKVVVWGARI